MSNSFVFAVRKTHIRQNRLCLQNIRFACNLFIFSAHILCDEVDGCLRECVSNEDTFRISRFEWCGIYTCLVLFFLFLVSFECKIHSHTGKRCFIHDWRSNMRSEFTHTIRVYEKHWFHAFVPHLIHLKADPKKRQLLLDFWFATIKKIEENKAKESKSKSIRRA